MATSLEDSERQYEADRLAWERASADDREAWCRYYSEHPHRDADKRMAGTTPPDGPHAFFARQRAATRKHPWFEAADEYLIGERMKPKPTDLRRKPPEAAK